MRRLLLLLALLPALALSQPSHEQNLSKLGLPMPANSVFCNPLATSSPATTCTAGNGISITGGQISSTGGSGGGSTFQVNGTNLLSQSTVNFANSAVTYGLTLGLTNTSSGNIQLGLSGTLSAAGGGTGATSLAGASIPTYTGTITPGHCVGWASTSTLNDAGACGGATTVQLQSVSTNTNLSTSENAVTCNASSATVTLTLPTAIGATTMYFVKKTDSSAHYCTIATTGGQTIDGASTQSLQFQYTSVTILSDNANWWIF
jgi:hypothetical protein